MTVVAITTSSDRADAAARPFRERGFTPIALPCIRIEPAPATVLGSARDAAASADFLFVTSARTVKLLWPIGGMPAVPVAAVGAATAHAAAQAGGRVDLIGDGAGIDLVDRLEGDMAEGTVVFPHAAGADSRTLAALRSGRRGVRAFEIYQTVPVAPGSTPVDAVAFASTSAVSGWFLGRDVDEVVVAAIGRETAAGLSRFGVAPDVIPDVPGFDQMAAALREAIP